MTIVTNIERPKQKYVDPWPVCSFFAIYDGHGGHKCGNFLKENLDTIIINQACFPSDPEKALILGCAEAERRFLSYAEKCNDTSGSCAIIVLTVDEECYVANVGDSRAILSTDHGKDWLPLSRDHCPSKDYEVKRITANGGQIYP